MFNREDCIKYVKNFVDRIKSKGIDIKVAKIFGSYSKNMQNENSDIDVLLVSDVFVGAGFIDNGLIAQELYDYDLIQVKTYSVEDYNEGDDPLLEEINKTAIILN